jgi:hypothetical protein
MRTKIGLTLLVIASVLIGAAVWISRLDRAERQRQFTETQNALRKTVEFLTPDTGSDLRFGKKGPATPPPSTPASAVP